MGNKINKNWYEFGERIHMGVVDLIEMQDGKCEQYILIYYDMYNALKEE